MRSFHHQFFDIFQHILLKIKDAEFKNIFGISLLCLYFYVKKLFNNIN